LLHFACAPDNLKIAGISGVCYENFSSRLIVADIVVLPNAKETNESVRDGKHKVSSIGKRLHNPNGAIVGLAACAMWQAQLCCVHRVFAFL
jgi:hypothetical protein